MRLLAKLFYGEYAEIKNYQFMLYDSKSCIGLKANSGLKLS